MTKERTGLMVALLLIVWLTSALARVESQRYALQMGMCWSDVLKLPDLACIERVETRTAWYWHVFHALRG